MGETILQQPLKSVLDGTEAIEIQEAAGGVDSSKHATVGAVADYVAKRTVRISVLGDSLSAQQSALMPNWPAMLREVLQQSGNPVEVLVRARSGHSFYRANITALFGTNTAVQQVIADKPDIVIVALGYNDAVTEIDARTPAQQQADALQTFTDLRTALPNAKILYMSQRAYDATNYPDPGTTLLNKAVLGTWFQKKTTGILTGYWTGEILEDAVASTTRTKYGNWLTLDNYIRGLSQIDHSAYWEIWKIHRMGGHTSDMLHLASAGMVLSTGYVLKALENTAFNTLLRIGSNAASVRNDPDLLFTAMFSASGTNWVLKTDLGDQWVSRTALWNQLRPSNWYLPLNVQMTVSHGKPDGVTALASTDRFRRVITGAQPNTSVLVSTDGGAFGGGAVTTDAEGNQTSSSAGSWFYINNAGQTRTYRYRIGDIVLDPITLTFNDASNDIVTLTANTTLALTNTYQFHRVNSSSIVTITVPPESSVPWPADAQIEFMQTGTAALRLAAGSGVTFRKRASTQDSGGQWAVCGIRKIGTNEWVLFGDFA